MSDIRCTYRRIKTQSRDGGYYLTSCGFRLKSISFGWQFCPFCGKPFLKMI